MEKSGVMTLELEVTAAKLTGDPARDIKSLSNHVFMMEEKLRYTLRNLDVTNFNDLGLARYENGRLQIYTKEITAQTDKLRVEFGKETDEIHALISATADELLAEIEDVEGNYTTLKASVNGLTTRVGDVEGRYSSLNQTVTGIQSTVSGHTNSITTLRSDIQQTNSKIAAVVSAVDDSSGNVTAASIVAAINGASSSVKISADHVSISGFVTFEDLSGNGTTSINGSNITSGVISGITLESQGYQAYENVTISDGAISIAGGSVTIGSNGYGSGYMAADTELLLEGASAAYLQCGWNYCVATQGGAKISYDYDTYQIWVDGNGCWSNKAMTVYSDKRLKSQISYDMEKYEKVFAELRPCSFLYNDEKDGKRHMGFVAQEFVQAANDAGMTEDDFAMIGSDGEYYGIAYGEMTALNTHMIQKLMERVERLEEL